MTAVWVVTLNGHVEAVCATPDLARQAMSEVRARVSQCGRAGTWRTTGGADPATAMSWSAQAVTSLRAERWTVEQDEAVAA